MERTLRRYPSGNTNTDLKVARLSRERAKAEVRYWETLLSPTGGREAAETHLAAVRALTREIKAIS